MYERYWHLDRPAFESDFDSEFYFPARSHEGALLKLRFVLEHRKGIALLVGDHGVGKSYLTHVLEQEVDRPQMPFLRLLFPQLSPTDMLNYLAIRLGASPGPGVMRGSPEQTLCSLENHLALMASEGQRRVVLLDDAHLLQPAHFETLQLLMSLQQHAGNVISLILIGRPELLSRVERVPGLDQRVAVRMAIDPLTPDEGGQYVEHRLRVSGRSLSMFHSDAYQSFWELSQGIPRRLNQLCDLSLLVGYADGLTEVTCVEVEAAAQELAAVSLD